MLVGSELAADEKASALLSAKEEVADGLSAAVETGPIRHYSQVCHSIWRLHDNYMWLLHGMQLQAVAATQ